MPANVRVYDVKGWVITPPVTPAQVRVYAVSSFAGTAPTANPAVKVFSVQALTAFTSPAPTAFAGADITNQEPWQVVALDGSGDPGSAGGTIDVYQWTQIAGTPTPIIGADQASASIEVPGSVNGETLTFGLVVTDSFGGVSNTQTVNITTLPCATLIVRGGAWTPYKPVLLPFGNPPDATPARFPDPTLFPSPTLYPSS